MLANTFCLTDILGVVPELEVRAQRLRQHCRRLAVDLAVAAAEVEGAAGVGSAGDSTPIYDWVVNEPYGGRDPAAEDVTDAAAVDAARAEIAAGAETVPAEQLHAELGLDAQNADGVTEMGDNR